MGSRLNTKVDFKAKKLTKAREANHLMIKESIYQKE